MNEKLNKNFKTRDNQQQRLVNLNIIPLGGVAMARRQRKDDTNQ